MKFQMMIATTLICAFSAQAIADEARSYKEGVVSNIVFVKTKPGKFDAYMKYLDATYKPQMEEMKKANIIIGYSVGRAQPHNLQEPDVILRVVYSNMAALDNLPERTDAIAEKFQGDREKQSQAAIERESMREILGSQLVRELILK